MIDYDALRWWLLNPVATIHLVNMHGQPVVFHAWTKDDWDGYAETYTDSGTRWYTEWHDSLNPKTAEQMEQEIYGVLPRCLNCYAPVECYDPLEEGPLCFCGWRCQEEWEP